MKENFTLEEEKNIIVGALKTSGHEAYEATLKSGVPVTVLKGNNVCRVESDGKVRVVAKSRQAKFRVVKRKYIL